MSDLISVEDAAAQGVSSSPIAVVLNCDARFRVPYSVQGANVLRYRTDPDKPGVFICENVVFSKPVVFGDPLILVRSTAPLLGFYNAEPGVICPAYGAPVLDKAWKVTVGSTFRPVVMNGVVIYESIVMNVVEEYRPIPQTDVVENKPAAPAPETGEGGK